MSIDHWMMFGTFVQQDYFEYPSKGTYKGVLINANMATHAPAGLAAFLLEKTEKSIYIIDPLTHAFQHHPVAVLNKEGKIKSSIRKLAESYGEPFISLVGSKPLLVKHIQDEELLKDLVLQCLVFQKDHLTSYMKESNAAKYLEGDAEIHPYAVIAPYFFMTETNIDDWLDINIKCAKYARNLHKDANVKLFASVVISQGILVDENYRTQIAESLNNVGLDGFIIWIDNFDEQTASKLELKALLKFANILKSREKTEIINLHGGYFSTLAAGPLGNNVLSGVCHGPEFGESRAVVPVGGGIPIARYYIPDLHSRVKYKDALRMFFDKDWLSDVDTFHKNVCDCEECQKVLSGDVANFRLFGDSNPQNVRRGKGIVRMEFPTKETQERCLKHYLHRKKREFEASANAPKETLLNNLTNGYDKYKNVAGSISVGHLKLWRKIYENI